LVVCFIVVYLLDTVVVFIIVTVIGLLSCVRVRAIAIASRRLDSRFESIIGNMPPVVSLVIIIFESDATTLDKSLREISIG